MVQVLLPPYRARARALPPHDRAPARAREAAALAAGPVPLDPHRRAHGPPEGRGPRVPDEARRRPGAGRPVPGLPPFAQALEAGAGGREPRVLRGPEGRRPDLGAARRRRRDGARRRRPRPGPHRQRGGRPGPRPHARRAVRDDASEGRREPGEGRPALGGAAQGGARRHRLARDAQPQGPGHGRAGLRQPPGRRGARGPQAGGA